MSALVAIRAAATVPAADAAGTPVQAVALSGIEVRFGALSVIQAMSLSVREGEFVALLGPSGCGKSTLLKVIAGLVPVASGTVSVGPATRRLGMMFQKPLLLPWRTILSNTLLPMELQRGRGGVGAADRQRALELLALIGLRDFADAYPHQLSGGMQQRAALARTLMSDPDLLLLDEPFGALDELTRERLNEELVSLWRSGVTRLKTVIMVTHSVPEAVTMSDRVVVLAPRPARVVDSLDIALGYPRDATDIALVNLIAETRALVRGVM
jgi:NitT/TauT family transport system ATP-binding protein